MKMSIMMLALLALVAIGCRSEEPEVSVNVDEAYRRLAERAVVIRGLYEEAEIRAGVAADEIASYIPSNAVILGTVTRKGTAGTSSKVFLELPQEPEEGVNTLTGAFDVAGWRVTVHTFRQYDEGIDPGETSFMSSLCQGQDSHIYVVGTRSPETSVTEVSIYLEQGSNAAATCAAETSRRTLAENILPPLPPPSGGQVVGYSGRSPLLVYLLSTSSTARETYAYYATQVESAGWSQIEQGGTEWRGDRDASVWSLWTFTDSEGRAWAGALIVGPPPESLSGSQFSLLMSLEAVPLGHYPLVMDLPVVVMR